MSKKNKQKFVAKKEPEISKYKDFFRLEHDTKKMTSFEIMTSSFLYLFLSSFALIVSKNVYGDITETKLYTLITMFGLWLLVMIFGFVEKAKRKNVNTEYFKNAVKNLSVTDIALISYTLTAFVSAITSEYRYTSFMGVPARNEGLLIQLLYISTFFILSRTYVNKLELKIFALASIPVALLGILQVNGYYVGILTYDILKYGKSYVTTIGNIDVVSTYLVTPIILFSVLYCQTEEKFWRLLYLASASICFYFSILIGVRSGYVGMIAAVGVMFPFIAKDRISSSRLFQVFSIFLLLIYLEDQVAKYGMRDFVIFSQPYKNLMVIGAIACAVISVMIFFLGKYVKITKKFIWPLIYFIAVAVVAGIVIEQAIVMEKPSSSDRILYILYEMGQILKGNISDDFGSNRIYAWKVAWRFFKEKPLVGHGPDTVFDLWMREEYIYSIQKYNVYFDKVHNDYLQVLVTTGILGFVSYITFQLSLFIRSFKKFDQPVVVALAAASVCFCAQAFFNIGVPIVSPYGWILFGMLASILRKPEQNDSEQLVTGGEPIGKKNKRR